MSLFGEERVVVIRNISVATVGELSALVAYLEQPADSTRALMILKERSESPVHLTVTTILPLARPNLL